MDASIHPIADTLDRLVGMASGRNPGFRELALAAGLDPATDFRGADLRDLDFRDDDLAGFSFRGADLTGCDFRRARGIAGDALDGALVHGAIGLPEAIEARRGEDGCIAPSDDPRVADFMASGPSSRDAEDES